MSTRARTPLLLVLLSLLLAPGSGEAQGILLLAHGGRDDWNQKVLELAAQVDSTRPVEVAFGMANKRTIQDALHRLEQRDVTDVVAVPLFVSSHSSVFRATEYLLGSREDAPPQLEAFARMAARRSGGGGTGSDPGFEWTTPVETAMPISVTMALDGHALVAEILLSRAADVSQHSGRRSRRAGGARAELGRGQRPVAREHEHAGRADAPAHALQPLRAPDGA